jgi:hypothetical protein
VHLCESIRSTHAGATPRIEPSPFLNQTRSYVPRGFYRRYADSSSVPIGHPAVGWLLMLAAPIRPCPPYDGGRSGGCSLRRPQGMMAGTWRCQCRAYPAAFAAHDWIAAEGSEDLSH